MVSERLECAGLESLSADAQTLAPAALKFVHRPHALWADRTNRDHFQCSMTWCSWRRDRSADAPLQSLTRMQPIETGRMAKLVMPGLVPGIHVAARRGPFYFAWGCFRDFVSGLRGVPPKRRCAASGTRDR